MRKVLFLILSLFSLTGKAQKVQIDGIHYDLNPETQMAQVTFESRNEEGHYVNSYTGNIEIPSVVADNGIEYKVITIGEGAFANAKSLQTVKLPDGLTLIDAKAFGNCEGLMQIEIPASVDSIGQYAFIKCKSLTTVKFSGTDSATPLKLGSGVFYGCSELESITLPKLKSLPTLAFAECRKLKELKHNGIDIVGSKAFLNCTSLSDMDFSRIHDGFLMLLMGVMRD